MSKRRRLVWGDEPVSRALRAPNEEIRAYRINDAARNYSISRATLYRLIKAEKLRAVRVGARRLILREDLEALINGGIR